MASAILNRRSLAAGAVLLLLTSCSAREGGIDDPIQRKLQWFSFVGGDDIREACSSQAPARYRFVYNAVWEEQVRVYELRRLERAQGATLKVNVIRGAPRLLQAYLIDSQAVGEMSREARLDEPEYLDLERALEQAGFGHAAADGTRLQSFDFYWLVNACVAGNWRLNAWRRQDPGFDRLGFDKLLFGHDRTGVAINQPRAIDAAQRLVRYGEAPSERARAVSDSFELVIRNGRLFGHGRLF